MRTVVDATALLQAQNYRSFLFAFYETNKKLNPQFSYSYLAKKCEFGAKSFIKDVIDGKKNLTYESTAKIISGLALPLAWKNYLENLIRLELVASESEKMTIKKNIESIKRKLQNKTTITINEKAGDFFRDKNWPYVYAALGTVEKGATLEHIAKRTRLPALEIEKTLNFMTENNLVEKKERRYFPLQNEAFFAGLGQSNFFQSFFLQSMLNAGERAQKKFKSDDDLFFSMSVSIQSQKMAQFKIQLAELLDKFSQTIEDPEGDRVADLVCGFSKT